MKIPFKLATSIFILLTLLTFESISQNNTQSVYSRYGVGELQGNNSCLNDALGGSGIGLRDPFSMNFKNPASLSSMLKQNVIFEFSLKTKGVSAESENSKSSYNLSNFNYLQIAFPVNNWYYMGFGIKPFSSIGYEIETSQELNGETVIDNFTGDGGISQIFFSNAIKPLKFLSLGFQASYLWGNMKRQYVSHLDYPNEQYISVSSATIVNSRVKGLLWNFGLQAHPVWGENFTGSLGITFDNQTKIQSYDSKIIYSKSLINNLVKEDTIQDNLSKKKQTDLPMGIGGGISIQWKKKLTLLLDYRYENWENLLVNDEPQAVYQNSSSVSLGLQYIPQIGSPKFFNNIRYRAGFFYSNSNLKILGQSIQDKGVTFGLALPKKGSGTMTSVSFILGQRGSTSNGLIRENYFQACIALSLNDIWFIKRRYE